MSVFSPHIVFMCFIRFWY